MSGTYDDEAEDQVEDGEEGQSAEISEVDIKKLLAETKAEAEKARAENSKLKEDLEKERQGRNKAESGEKTAYRQQLDAYERAASEQLNSYKASAADLKRQIIEAHREGQSERWADLNDELATLRAKEAHDQRQFDTFKSQKEQYIAQAERQAQQPQQQDPLAGYSAKQRAWVNDHPEYLSDPKHQKMTFAAANYAANILGHEVDSPEYFQYVNDVLDEKYYGRKKPEPAQRRTQQQRDTSVFDEEDFEPSPPPRRKSVDGGLPVTRGTNGGAPVPRRAKGASLSREQRDAADIALSDLPMSGPKNRYDAYAESLERMARNGMN